MARILGGETARLGELPYMAFLSTKDQRYVCCAAIISKRHILSSGVCVVTFVIAPYKNIKVVTGTIFLYAGGESHNIIEAVAHPTFLKNYPKKIRYDIAIIIVSNELLKDKKFG